MTAFLAPLLNRLSAHAQPGKAGPIGIDCALHALHMVQMERDEHDNLRVCAAASQRYGTSREATLSSVRETRAVVRGAMTQAAFRGSNVVSALPAAHAEILPVTYTLAAGQSEEQALNNVLAQRLEEDLSDLVIDYLPIRSEDAEERTALVAVAPREQAIGLLELFRRCGLKVERLEIGPVAIRRLVHAMGSTDRIENVLVINFGRDASYMTVISGRRLLLDQQVSFGEKHLVGEVAAALEMEPTEVPSFIAGFRNTAARSAGGRLDTIEGVDAIATLKEIIKPSFLELVEEINRILIYTASQTRGESIDRIYLMGGMARWHGVDQFLNSLVHLKVETIPNPLDFFSPEDGERHAAAAPELAVATGLALSGLLEDENV